PYHPLADTLRRVRTLPALVAYLHDHLGWPVDVEDWNQNVFDWLPEELRLKPVYQVKVKSVQQLRPLVSGQPWGIFFVEFEPGRLPITVLRRVLNALVPKGRAQDGGHQTWHMSDLLFVSSFDNGSEHEIALAHFSDESANGDLPTLRVLGWHDDHTPMQLGHLAQTLEDKLRWPAACRTAEQLQHWRTQWASAFTQIYRQNIHDAKTLAGAMAELAKRIRSRVNTVLELESASGYLHQMHKAFRDNLIADLSADAFADMFAQTITYGLFTARASRDSGALTADNLADMVPSTNPFLKELLGNFLSASGRARRKNQRLDFDELDINEVVSVLRQVDMQAVLRSFNSSKPGDDPVIHFYEDFLKAYDRAMRAKRGVFYTPGPVVQFIVKSVDSILKTGFGIADGLASTITWGEMVQRMPALKLPRHCTRDTPFVQVLDPATGTGTFVVEVINHIHAHMKAQWAKQGKASRAEWLPLWQDYVQHHLLPRLYAFELMMAPYAIAHMKIGLKLHETGYTFAPGGPRVNVFLTNALEPAHDINPGLEFEAPMLAHEAAAANKVKEETAATVVLGNPPYSGHSANNNVPGIVAAVHEYKRGYPDLQKPGQGKWLQNDYVKFIRFSEMRILNAGIGILGFITDHSYLDNPTFKGMRRHLRQSFPYLRIVDLHGNSKKHEKAADGSKDESVFDITQGTAIGLYVHGSGTAGEKSLDIYGSEAFKAETMLRISLEKEALTNLNPNEPLWLFKPQAQDGRIEYENGWGLPLIFSPNGDPAPGIVTTHDEFAISWDAAEAKAKVNALLATADEAKAREIFKLCTQNQWNYKAAKKALADGAWKEKIVSVLYRPFDIRTTIYDSHVAVHRRDRVSLQVIDGKNLSLISCRQQSQYESEWNLVGVARGLIESCTISNKTKEINYLFPTWLIGTEDRKPNLAGSFVNEIQSALHLQPSDYRPQDPSAPLHAEKIFHYLYAVLHSPAYRQRYAAFLRTDFARIPIPASRPLFDALAALGAQLVAWHLLEHPNAQNIPTTPPADQPEAAWFGTDYTLQKVAEKSRQLAEITETAEIPEPAALPGGQGSPDHTGKLYINATSGFAQVRQRVWQHSIGGYQVLHKWLDDRRKAGRSLSQQDITHWQRIYAACQATQTLMQQVDSTIQTHGGWQSAFSHSHPPPSPTTLASEQQVQKQQRKAHQKTPSAPTPSPMGASSLFEYDDDLEPLARAAGAKPGAFAGNDG
ncbi:MAG: hypothetical protein ORN29_04805, partial [Rhodoferax sp.]|nr:hypothetical protein [Rhodoferax sp.]